MLNKPVINVIWFKRDLRLRDHAPLEQAITDGLPTLLLYCFEPSLIASPQSDVRHWRFVYESLLDIQTQLQAYAQRMYWVHNEVIPCLTTINEYFQINRLYSYAEVGTKLTFDRDKAVKNWCQLQAIHYQEFPQSGIIRGRKHRLAWTEHVEQNYFTAPQNTADLARIRHLDLPNRLLETWEQSPLPAPIQQYETGFQPGGERLAWRYFQSFIHERSKTYSRNMSKPGISRLSCSRLSPYLAFGCISARAVIQTLNQLNASDREKKNLDNFRSRIWWRSHMIQKLESDWRIEFTPINPVFEQLSGVAEGAILEAWKFGQTGFPMVDASMRCLQATGWVNFRMRAMLVSFATFALGLDWRPVADHLARLFLDFDPGIHYPQVQMQAGLTGYHTLRIYNPTVQVQEHDVEGVFIKQWIPELQHVPTAHLAEPWKMTLMEQSFYRCLIGQDYPSPIVEFNSSIAQNKAKYWALRESSASKAMLPKLLEIFCMPKVEFGKMSLTL